MTSPAIDLFKVQLNSLLETMATERNLFDRKGVPCADLALPYWFLETFLGYTEGTSANDITEGFDDLAIDAIVISDDDTTVHFYQFKNPQKQSKGIEGGDVDKLVSGIELILQSQHGKVANSKLKDKIDEIRQKPRTAYCIHFVTTGGGLPGDGKFKLEALCKRWATRGTSPLKYDCSDISDLQQMYYNKTLPTLDATVQIKPAKEPYAVQIGSHRSFVFHLSGRDIASLYIQHGERILQQNIRTSEGDSETNKAIFRSATGKDSKDFYHFNNGITILSDLCVYDQFGGSLSVTRPQVVNGGQTMRVLADASQKSMLKADVFVAVRVLTSDSDRAFAGNVAVNLNNQTMVKPSFLRSNHPEIIQLGGTLATQGYYLERREGELSSLSEAEVKAIEASIRNPLKDHTIDLQPACQAYIAFFHANLEVAKKNPRFIFASAAAGGYFERFINSGITAERFIFAWQLFNHANRLKRAVAKLSRTRNTLSPEEYRTKLKAFSGRLPAALDPNEVEAAAPQSAAFLVALSGKKYNENSDEMLLKHKDKIAAELPRMLFELVAKTAGMRKRTWPGLLKSQDFLETAVGKLRLKRVLLE